MQHFNVSDGKPQYYNVPPPPTLFLLSHPPPLIHFYLLFLLHLLFLILSFRLLSIICTIWSLWSIRKASSRNISNNVFTDNWWFSSLQALFESYFYSFICYILYMYNYYSLLSHTSRHRLQPCPVRRVVNLISQPLSWWSLLGRSVTLSWFYSIRISY